MSKIHTLGVGIDVGQVRAHVFGHLVKLADGVLTAYHSDLYHDALWLRDVLNGPMTFCWSVGESGTGIGEDEKALYRTHQYRCVVTEERQRWTLTVTGS